MSANERIVGVHTLRLGALKGGIFARWQPKVGSRSDISTGAMT